MFIVWTVDDMVIPHTEKKCSKTAACKKCAKNGHLERFCRLNMKCYKCGKTGHMKLQFNHLEKRSEQNEENTAFVTTTLLVGSNGLETES